LSGGSIAGGLGGLLGRRLVWPGESKVSVASASCKSCQSRVGGG
jgi:hypothetical protein